MADVTKTLKVQIQAVLGNAGKDVNKLTNSLKDLKTGAKGASGSLDMAGVAVGSFVGQLAVGAVTAFATAVGQITTQIVELGTKTEKSIAQISAMKNYVGDATEAYRLFNDVGRSTNFNLDSVQQMGTQLLNLGYSAQNASDLLKLCADTSAGLNRGEEGARQLVDAISRIQATGELSSRQLIQLQMAGLDLDEAFKSVNLTSEEAMKAMQDGTLDSQKALDALIGYMHNFDGAMAKSKNNVTDLWGDVASNVETAMAEMGASIFQAFNQSGIIQTLINFTQDIIDLVRGDGVGAFSDLGEIASYVLDGINTLLDIVTTALKAIIVVVSDVYGAFKSFGQNVYSALQPAIDALLYVYDLVKGILSAIGKNVAGKVQTKWGQLTNNRKDNSFGNAVNNFKPKRRRIASGGGGGGGGGSASAVSQEQKKVEALIEKYADAGKIARNLTKSQIELAKVNLGMMSEELKVTEEKKVKLATLNLAHETLMAGLKDELETAKKIADANTQKKVVDAINAQITAQNNLLEAKKKQVEFDDVRNQQKLKDSAFEQEMQHIQNLADMQKVFADQRIQMENNVLMQRKAQLEQMLQDDRLYAEERIKIETQLAETINQLNANSATTVKGGWQQALQEIANQQVNFKDAIVGVFGSITDGLTNLVTATGSAKDRFKNFLKDVTNSILKAMTQIIIRGLVTRAIMGAIGMGGSSSYTGGYGGFSNWNANPFTTSKLFASGGLVTGAGTSRSDSIPAMLSNGEYVLNASAVKRIGVPRLNAMNRYATGGYVGGSTSTSAPNVVINVENQTGQQINARQGESSFDGKSYVIGVVLEGLATNENGMRDIFKGVATT